MAGGALLVVTLTHRTGRRLRRKRLGTRGSGHEHESNQHHRYPDHDPPFAGIRPVPPLEKLISYFTRTVARCDLFHAVVPQSFVAVWCGRNIVPPMRLRGGQTRGYISAGKLFRQELVSKSLSARACQQELVSKSLSARACQQELVSKGG